MKTLQTPVKWKIGFEGTKHTFTGYSSKTTSDTIRQLAKYYMYQLEGYDFGHALEMFFKDIGPPAPLLNLNKSELRRLRHNVIERIKTYWWFENPELEYFQLTEEVIRYSKTFNDDFYLFLHQCADSCIRNDTPLTTPTTNNNIGFI